MSASVLSDHLLDILVFIRSCPPSRSFWCWLFVITRALGGIGTELLKVNSKCNCNNRLSFRALVGGTFLRAVSLSLKSVYIYITGPRARVRGVVFMIFSQSTNQ
jgi:hypothetical protein